jgi:hypothetical protein
MRLLLFLSIVSAVNNEKELYADAVVEELPVVSEFAASPQYISKAANQDYITSHEAVISFCDRRGCTWKEYYACLDLIREPFVKLFDTVREPFTVSACPFLCLHECY